MQKKKSYLYSYLFQEYSCVLPTVLFAAGECCGCYGGVFLGQKQITVCHVHMHSLTLTEQTS